jgi:hypothetical protein
MKNTRRVDEIDNIEQETLDAEERYVHLKFLSFYIERAIKKFPKSFDLRVHSANVQCFRLDNEFKATFDLMKCEK